MDDNQNIVPFTTDSKMEDEHVEKTDLEHGGSILIISDEESRRMRRRVHLRILPFLCLAYLCQALDKGTLGAASIMGWLKDVGLKGQEYQLTSTFVWVGTIVAAPLAAQGVRRLPLGKYLGYSVLIWSALVLGLGFSLKIAPVFAIRFLQGVFESTVGPACVAVMVQWYTIAEQPMVCAVWECMLGMSNVVGSLLAYGFYHVHSSGLKGWQWLHIVIAIISTAIGLSFLFFLPDEPAKARWASKEQKTRFIERVRCNNQSIKVKEFKRYQMVEAFTDVNSWCLFFLPLFNTLIVGGINTFGRLLIVSAFGFTPSEGQLLNIPVGVIQALTFLGIGWVISKKGETCLAMVAFTVPNIIGTIVLLTVTPGDKTKGGLVVAFYCMQVFGACYPACLMLLARNIAGQSKRSITYAFTFIGWASGNSIAPQLFQSKWAPRYFNSLYIHLGLYACFISTSLLTRQVLVKRNRAKVAAAEAAVAESGLPQVTNAHAFEDLTDIENPDFRYSF